MTETNSFKAPADVASARVCMYMILCDSKGASSQLNSKLTAGKRKEAEIG